MHSLAEIEAAVKSLPQQEQQELLRHLTRELEPLPRHRRDLPLIPATGRQITQEEVDDARDSD
jgi:hypothetical protein